MNGTTWMPTVCLTGGKRSTFGSATAGVATADPDGDQADNLKEYRRSTNPLVGSAVFYVDPVAGNDAYDGFTQIFDGTHGPKATIQAAIDAASPDDGCRVILLPGTHRGSGDAAARFNGKMLSVQSTNPDDPAVVAATIIDGRDCGAGVAFMDQEPAGTELAGVTVTGCWYAGIGCYRSSPTIRNCVIQGNMGEGGGVVCNEADVHLIGCTIDGNTSWIAGGGIQALHGNLIVSDCIISNNSALACDASYGNLCS